VLLTHHQHGDNLDELGRAFLASVGTVVTTPSAARHLGAAARGLTRWGTTELTSAGRPTIEVTATPARHGPPLSRPIVGEATGFALRWPGQTDGVLWISGDTVLFDGVREVARQLQVDTALLHLGRVRFPVTGPVTYTMTARDAVDLCRDLCPRTVVPVHYEGWSHFSEGREAAEQEFARAPDEVRRAIRWLPLGEAVEAAT
jgi:L-ascorbate metabolism protein UlaG (beta-lactamase superfamily)